MTEIIRFGGLQLSVSPTTASEQQLVSQRVSSYLKACRVVADVNACDRFVKRWQGVHLILNRDHLLSFAQAYHLTNEGADQLVRLGVNQEKLATIGDGHLGPSNDLMCLQVLIQYLFEENAFDWRMAVWNKMQCVSLPKGVKLYLVPRSKYTDCYTQGIILDINNDTIALVFPGVNTGLLKQLQKSLDGKPAFFNVEQYGKSSIPTKKFDMVYTVILCVMFFVLVWMMESDPYGSAGNLALVMALSLLPYAFWIVHKEAHLRAVDRYTGLLKYYDYAMNDPDCLVKQYRRHM